MFKGYKKGYKYFFRGNIVFIIFLFISLLGNDFKEVSFTVITMLIMATFGFVFYNYKHELYN
jgi:magnesium-transporting ATPase (P-type)